MVYRARPFIIIMSALVIVAVGSIFLYIGFSFDKNKYKTLVNDINDVKTVVFVDFMFQNR